MVFVLQVIFSHLLCKCQHSKEQTQYVGALSEIQPTQREEITFDYYLILSHIVYSVVSPIITYNTAFVTLCCHQYPVLISMTTTSSCH